HQTLPDLISLTYLTENKLHTAIAATVAAHQTQLRHDAPVAAANDPPHHPPFTAGSANHPV
uniref:hypothetical protein n=1 Tax=Klebsiella pneumoniae TaxID=573 RepID=UPI003D6634E9